MQNVKFHFAFFFVLVSLGLNLPNASASEISPSEMVDEFHGTLLKVMKNAKSLSAKERYEKLEHALDRAFEFKFMVRLASGTSWSKASKQHRSYLTQAFRRMSIATYAYRFKSYSDQRFVTIKTAPGMRQTKLVFTKVVSPSKNGKDDITKLTYVTKKFGPVWKIIDILLAGGISELSVRYSEYRATLRTKGALGLARILNKKADELISD